MDTLLSRHLPIITTRLQFFPRNIGPPPVITTRIDFAKRLAMVTREDSLSTDDDGTSSAMDSDINAAFVAPATPATPPADISSDSGVEENSHLLNDTLDKKISKPRGQVGHPGSGGYSLDFVLRNWGSTLISDVNKLVKQKADQLLDTSTSFRMQNSAEIDDICVIVEQKFPIVRKYQNNWPVRDMLKLHLKYTSEISRKGEKGKGRGRRQ